MFRTAKLNLIGFLSLCSVAALQVQAASLGETEKEIVALEQQFTEAYKANNTESVASLVADKFIGVDAHGKIWHKADGLADMKATKVRSVTSNEMSVTTYGNTAIATYVFTAKGTDSKGKPMDLHERDTDTWVKMPDGKWQCVASISSRVK